MANRVLLLTPYLASRRGNSLTAERISNGLAAAGWEVNIISLEDPNWQAKATMALNNGSWDLLHGLHATSVASALSIMPSLQQLPLILTMTGTDLNYGFTGADREITRQIVSQAQRLVVFNDYYLDRLGTWQPEWGTKARVIPQGVTPFPPSPPATYSELDIALGKTTFIISSGLRPVKNLELAIDGLSLAYAEDNSLQLIIVGPIIDPEYSVQLLETVNNQPWANYWGEYPHHDMATIIKQADVIINSSHSEGQPQAVLEAMSLGLPCLLRAVPGNLDLITDGNEGYYFNQAEDLAARALELMHHQRRRDMGRAAQLLIQRKHNPEQEIAAYLDLYAEIQQEI